MSESNTHLCPYCKIKDLAGLNETNTIRHTTKCKQINPLKRSLIQSKLNFQPKARRTETENARESSTTTLTEPDFGLDYQISSDYEQVDPDDKTTPYNPDAEIIQTGPGKVTLSNVDVDIKISESNIQNTSGASNHIKVEETIPYNAPPHPLVCLGYNPNLENLFNNFPFQLLPALPNIIICGSSFHHKSCVDGCFKLQHNSSESINKCCSSLLSDNKFNAIINRASQSIQQIPSQTRNIFLTQTHNSVKSLTHYIKSGNSCSLIYLGMQRRW